MYLLPDFLFWNGVGNGCATVSNAYFVWDDVRVCVPHMLEMPQILFGDYEFLVM